MSCLALATALPRIATLLSSPPGSALAAAAPRDITCSFSSRFGLCLSDNSGGGGDAPKGSGMREGGREGMRGGRGMLSAVGCCTDYIPPSSSIGGLQSVWLCGEKGKGERQNAISVISGWARCERGHDKHRKPARARRLIPVSLRGKDLGEAFSSTLCA